MHDVACQYRKDFSMEIKNVREKHDLILNEHQQEFNDSIMKQGKLGNGSVNNGRC
jgi:hypothetical protein